MHIAALIAFTFTSALHQQLVLLNLNALFLILQLPHRRSTVATATRASTTARWGGWQRASASPARSEDTAPLPLNHAATALPESMVGADRPQAHALAIVPAGATRPPVRRRDPPRTTAFCARRVPRAPRPPRRARCPRTQGAVPTVPVVSTARGRLLRRPRALHARYVQLGNALPLRVRCPPTLEGA